VNGYSLGAVARAAKKSPEKIKGPLIVLPRGTAFPPGFQSDLDFPLEETHGKKTIVLETMQLRIGRKMA
jgi:hypothetical protein